MASNLKSPFLTVALAASALAIVIVVLRSPSRQVEEQQASQIQNGRLGLSEEDQRPELFEPFLLEHPEDRDRREAALVWYSRRAEDDDRLKHHTLAMITHHPGSMYIYFENGSLFYQEPEYREKVIAALEEQVKSGHTGHDVYWNLALACEQGAVPHPFKDEASRQRFLRYFELPDDTKLPTELDVRLADKAVKYYRLALDGAPEDYRSLYGKNLMELLVQLDRPDESVTLARNMMKTTSTLRSDASFLQTFGGALMEVGETADAEKVLKQVRAADNEGFDGGPGHPTTEAETLLGKIALDRGDTNTAAAHLLASVDVQPCCHSTTKGLSLRLAGRLLDAGEPAAVVTFCEIALGRFVPNQPETMALLAHARAKLPPHTQRVRTDVP